MPLVLSAAALTGCQQLNDGVNTINGAISSSLSSVGKALGGTATTQSLGPVSSVSGLGAVCKDYEENAMAAEKNWTGKRISIANATVLEVTKGRSASDMMTGMPKSAPNYYLLFKTTDTSYCGGMVWLDYASVALKCSRWSTCFQHSFWQCRFPPPGPPGLPDNACNSGKVMIDCAVCTKLKKFD